MRCTTATQWHQTGFIKHVKGGYEVAVLAEPADLFDCMPLSKPADPVAWVRVERPIRGPANIDHLRSTARLVAGAPAMRHALRLALRAGLLAGDAEAERAAREALAGIEG